MLQASHEGLQVGDVNTAHFGGANDFGVRDHLGSLHHAAHIVNLIHVGGGLTLRFGGGLHHLADFVGRIPRLNSVEGGLILDGEF